MGKFFLIDFGVCSFMDRLLRCARNDILSFDNFI